MFCKSRGRDSGAYHRSSNTERGKSCTGSFLDCKITSPSLLLPIAAVCPSSQFSSLYQSSGTDTDPFFSMGICVAGHMLLENKLD